MGENAAPAPPGPLASLIKDAQDGKLTVSFSQEVRVNADEFVYIERDCQAFKDEIRYLQAVAQNISDREHWGLGETTEGLNAASTLVGRFRGKAKIVDPGKDTNNNVFDILEQHYRIVDDIQNLHRTIAQKYIETDQEFAARYKELMATVAPSPIGTLTASACVEPPTLGHS
ncbi:hypothetical protein [Nocardia transvalensis]|uniref:hypothetical protein n=1 Tax=Nocardia transvalensis TaxID=37333 RepID=UPI0018948C33|nr:hypothetical protein [Nocardia transvalensis]MBF6333888.1 hypothetical protein [Nocardia transvalensis]